MEGGGVSNEQDYFEQMADIALADEEFLDKRQLRRQVILALKEVARDVRHAASVKARSLEGELFNMRPPYTE